MGFKQFVVDNVSDGFDLHNIEDGAFIRTFKTGDHIRPVPKNVLFAENSQLIIGGSDHGYVYIFDRKSGRKLAALRHSDKGLVQTVAVRFSECLLM